MRQSIDALRELAGSPSLFAVVVARGVSSVGDWLYLAALPILLYRSTGDVALVGVIAAGRLLPWLLLSIPAGIVVDRTRSRTVLLVTEATRAALMLLIGILAIAGAPLVYILVAAVGAAAASSFAMPAFGRFVPEIAPDDQQLGRANVVGSGLDSLACIIGPGVAALLIGVGGLEAAFLLNGLSFLAIVLVLGRVRVDASGTLGSDSADELTPAWSALVPAVARPLAVDAAVSFAAGLLMVLPVLAIASFGGDHALAGVYAQATGIGGVAGAAAAAAFINAGPRRGSSLGFALAFGGLVVVAAGSSPVTLVTGIVMSAAAVVALDTLNITYVQRTLDPRMLGRGLGLINTSAAVWVILGSLVPALLVGVVGLPIAMLGSAILVVALGSLGLCPTTRCAHQPADRAAGPPRADAASAVA